MLLKPKPLARQGRVILSTPDLYLQTAFILNTNNRIVSTREPEPAAGPLFALVRSARGCAWAIRSDVPQDLARKLDTLATAEPPVTDLRAQPVAAVQYAALIQDHLERSHDATTNAHLFTGPAFAFPDHLERPTGLALIETEQPLGQHFKGWVPGEIAAGRSPVLAVVKEGYPVSVCFCARRSDLAAEAGLETAPEYRRHGFAVRVTAAWALTVRDSGLIPLYSTSWTNEGSCGVARALGLIPYASHWSLSS